MCFGDNTKTTNSTQDSTSTSSGPDWLTNASKGNLDFVSSLQKGGFTPYSGQQVAGFSPQQLASFGLANNLAGSVNGGQIGQMLDSYSGAPAQSVNASTIASNMSPYMNAYVSQALAPQLESQNQQFASQNKGFDATATSAGAFGDTGWGLGKTNLSQQQDTARTGLVGQAYNSAFNTAIGAGAQDAANKLNADTSNANFAETALGRMLTGANTMYGMQTGAANLQNQFGQQQTQQDQATKNAAFNQWLMSQQYPFQTAQLMNSTLGTARGVAPSTTVGHQTGTSTTSTPDNSGMGILGSLLGMGMNFMLPGSGMMMGGMGGMMGGSSGTPGGTGGGLGGLYADGGSPPVGVPSIVGERGPELFVPTEKGVVIPAEVLEAAREKRDRKGSSAPVINFGIAA